MNGRTACLLLLGLAHCLWAGIALAEEAQPRRWRFGDYLLLIERTSGDGPFAQDLLTVRQQGRLLHAVLAAHIDFVTSQNSEAAAPALVAITEPAKRDLVIQSFSGGAHCCFSIEILTPGYKLRGLT
jgi:hypothetical protein